MPQPVSESAHGDPARLRRAQTAAGGAERLEQRFRVQVLADLHQHRGDLA